MSNVLFGGAVFASFLAGMVALFAPCCISVMLPAYFASTFDRRRMLIAMTFVFAAGVALIILPIALGAAGIGALINEQHLIVYLVGGSLMLAFGIYVLAGGRLMLPMPGMRARERKGPLAVFSLGAFSGMASACCAPVLAGVVALAGATGSFSAALILGIAYVFGMVFPLFVIALLWDRFNFGESRLLRGRTFRPRVLGRQLALHSTALASGLLLISMGVFAIVIGLRGNSMAASGWQLEVSARLQHYASVLTDWADTIGWITGIGLFALLGLLVWKALGQAAGVDQTEPPEDEIDSEDDIEPDAEPVLQSSGRTSIEWQNR